MKKLATKQIIFNSVLAVMLIVTLLAWIPAVVASMKQFYAGMEMTGAPYVGFQNYKSALVAGGSIEALMSSYVVSCLAAVIGGVLIYAISSLLMPAKKIIRISVVLIIALCSGLCMTVLMLDESIYPMLANKGYFSVAIYAVLEVLAYLAIPLVISTAYAKNNKDLLKISALFVVIRILMSLSFTGGDLSLFAVSYNAPPIATLQSLFYSQHRIVGDYCTTNALSVIGAFYSIPVVVAGAVIIHIMYKEKVGLITTLVCALIISLNQEGILYFCMRMLGHYSIIGKDVVLGYGYIIIRLLPYFAIFMLIWKITGAFKNSVIPVTVIGLSRFVLSRSLYVNAFMGIVPKKFLSEYLSIVQNSATTVDLKVAVFTAYATFCILVALICAASVWISAIINKEK